MKNRFTIALLFVCATMTYAQKKELTLSESVLQQYRAFRPDQMTGFSWVPKTDTYVYAEAYTTMKKANVKKNVLENWFTVQDVNLAAGVELYNLYGYSWKNDQELYFNNGRQIHILNGEPVFQYILFDIGFFHGRIRFCIYIGICRSEEHTSELQS